MRFDGFSVESYQSRFSGTFDVTIADGEEFLRYGNNVVLVVVGTVGPSTMKEDKLGDMQRTSTINVQSAMFVAPENTSEVLTQAGIHHQLSLPAVPQRAVATSEDDSFQGDDGTVVAPDGSVVTETGEVVGSIAVDEDESEKARGGAEESTDEWDDIPSSAPRAPVVEEEEFGRRTVARVAPPKDKALARFLMDVNP